MITLIVFASLFMLSIDIFVLLTLVNEVPNSVYHNMRNMFIIINGKALISVNKNISLKRRVSRYDIFLDTSFL